MIDQLQCFRNRCRYGNFESRVFENGGKSNSDGLFIVNKQDLLFSKCQWVHAKFSTHILDAEIQAFPPKFLRRTDWGMVRTRSRKVNDNCPMTTRSFVAFCTSVRGHTTKR